MHDTSHAHALAHFVRRLHELGPVQSTSQRLGPHWISSWQDVSPLHCTSQVVDVPQNTFFAQAWSPQTTRHGRFAGHVTSVGQDDVALQSITQTPSTHVPFVQPC